MLKPLFYSVFANSVKTKKQTNLTQIITLQMAKLGPDNNSTAYLYTLIFFLRIDSRCESPRFALRIAGPSKSWSGLRPPWWMPFCLDGVYPFLLYSPRKNVHHSLFCLVTLGSRDRQREEGCHGWCLFFLSLELFPKDETWREMVNGHQMSNWQRGVGISGIARLGARFHLHAP